MRPITSFDRYIEREIADKKAVYAAYQVTRGREIVCGGAFGLADREKGIPFTENSVLRLASMTKPLTGAAVMKAREMGLLSLSDKVSKYLPGFRSMRVALFGPDGEITGEKPAENELTVASLLNHTNGLGTGRVPCRILEEAEPGATLSSLVPRYPGQLLDFEPYTATGYSSTMAFDVAAYLVEMTSGMEYESFLRKHILEPLGMEDTGYNLTPSMQERLAKFYRADGEITFVGEEGRILPGLTNTFKAGGGRLYSTLSDYRQFALMLLSGGKGEDGEVLSPESVRLLSSPSLPASLRGGCEEWGLSMRVIMKKDPPAQMLDPGCYGWSGAYETHFFVDPGHDLAAILMKNISNGLGAGAPSARAFEKAVAEEIASDPVFWKGKR
ncbi:MAG: beta-lactamase family protein [Clostridia bacterium]|nr:beta-lactamase family protein [Clostridia bacterium]